MQYKPGRVIFGVDMKIVDTDCGKDLPHDGKVFRRIAGQGAVGHQVLFQGRGWRSIQDGWFPTGDVATIDPRRQHADHRPVEGRDQVPAASGSARSTGEHCGRASRDPGGAVSAQASQWDERPIVVAITKPGASVTKDELLKFYDGKIAKWWMPDDVVFVSSCRNGDRKLSKLTLRGEMKDYRLPNT